MKKPTALVTGIAGFAGSFLAERLLNEGWQVAGSLFKEHTTDNLNHLENRIKLVETDITDEIQVNRLIERTKPDYIFHLAALASVGQSFSRERETYRVNFDGTLNLLQAALTLKKLKRFLFVSSCDCFGLLSPKNKMLTEKDTCHPISPYAISKLAAEHLSLYYCHRHGLPVTIARAFNHTGPRQSKDFVVAAFARQIALIEAGVQKPVMKVGDLSARRDFSDVRDIVNGYYQLATGARSGELYHLCSGKSRSIKTILDRLLKKATVTVKVSVDTSLLRKNDIPIIRGDNRKAVQAIDYKPRYKIDTTLGDTLDYWRARVG